MKFICNELPDNSTNEVRTARKGVKWLSSSDCPVFFTGVRPRQNPCLAELLSEHTWGQQEALARLNAASSSDVHGTFGAGEDPSFRSCFQMNRH